MERELEYDCLRSRGSRALLQQLTGQTKLMLWKLAALS